MCRQGLFLWSVKLKSTDMIIGVPKEIKNNENRVAMTPAGVKELVARGHKVYVQRTAGEGSGFDDAAYEEAGAEMLPGTEDVYAAAEMIVKVKEPLPDDGGDKISWQYVIFPMDKFQDSEQLLCIENPRKEILRTALLDTILPYPSYEKLLFTV